MHDLESRRRSWKDAQEIVRSSQGPATQAITVHGAAQRLTTRHGGDGDGAGDRDGDKDSEGGEGNEGNEGDEGDEGNSMGVDDDTDVNAHRRRSGLGDDRRADTMTLSEWVAALVRLAWRCFPHASTIGARLSTLLEDFVLPGTQQSLRAAGLTATPDWLTQQLDSKKVPCMCMLHVHVACACCMCM